MCCPHLMLADVGEHDAIFWKPSEQFIQKTDCGLRKTTRIEFRAIFTEVSARVQLHAAALGGPMAALDEEEGRKADALNLATVGRSWELWKRRVTS